MKVPAPVTLPDVGARTDEAPPFCLVIIDGLREDVAWATKDAPMPWLQDFAKRGAWGTAIAGEPTLTAPCVRALLTGRRPDLLTGFRNFKARKVRGSIIHYLFERGAHTAHGGDAAAFQFCEDAYPHPERDVKQFSDQGPVDQGKCDAQAIPHILERIQAGADCLTLHLTKPDHAGHKYGALGPEYRKACSLVDGEIQGVVEAFLKRHPKGTVMIASDHGVSSMGTHGGGEAVAKRAPFVIVGPGVARAHLPSRGGSEPVDQCALAPTLCALMGLPQPPLADAPPDRRLMDLPREIEEGALIAYLEARIQVARSLHGDAVDVIERRRAEYSVLTLTDEVNDLLRPNSAGHATLALLVAAIWLVVLVAIVSAPGLSARVASRAALAALAGLTLAFLLTFDMLSTLSSALSVSAPVAGGLVLAGGYGAARALGIDAWRGAAFTVACLASVPILTGAGLTLQETFTGPITEDGSLDRSLVVVLILAVLCAVFLRPRRMGASIAAATRASPGLIAAFGGVLIGFTLTMRPFIDPYVRLRHLYGVAGVAIVLWMVWSRGLRGRPVWERAALALLGIVLFVATRLAEGSDLDPWVNLTPMRDLTWLFTGAALTLLVPILVRLRPGNRAADLPGILLATLALGGAFFLRLDADQGWLAGIDLAPGTPLSMIVVMAVNALGLAALVVTIFRGSANGRLLVRILAAVALARRLSVMDAEFAVFALVAVGAALAARAQVPTGRTALAWLAVGILAVRTAVFHAMGFEESFSTLDVGQAFAGLGGGDAQPLDAAGGAVITWQIMVAGIQLALRMALPWILIVAALSRAIERTAGATGGTLRCVLGDLALSFAARGAAIATAIWAWWRNNWWMTKAYTVFAYAAADVILLLVCASLCGAWTGATEEDAALGDAAAAPPDAPPAPVPAG